MPATPPTAPHHRVGTATSLGVPPAAIASASTAYRLAAVAALPEKVVPTACNVELPYSNTAPPPLSPFAKLLANVASLRYKALSALTKTAPARQLPELLVKLLPVSNMTRLPAVINAAPATLPFRLLKLVLLIVIAAPFMAIMPPKSKCWFPSKVLSTMCTVVLLMMRGADWLIMVAEV